MQDEFKKSLVNNNFEKASLLLGEGVDINQSDKDNNTPMHFAAFNGHVLALEFLLNKGAKINPVNVQGSTPMHLAAMKGHVGALEFLLIGPFKQQMQHYHA